MYSFKAVIFDLDGVVTKTAVLHEQAWKKVFDDYLKSKKQFLSMPFKEFTFHDYLTYVDGKPRYEGVKSFLESRGINLEWGNSNDDPQKETICGLGNRKNNIFCQLLKTNKPEVFSSTITFIKELKERKIRVGVASSSKNCRYILESAGILELFETIVDGVVSSELELKGKPEGDIFVHAAYNLGVLPKDAVVIEDAASGVEAGRNGGFGLVVGIARKNNEEELLSHYADIVVEDLSSLDIETIQKWFNKRPFYIFDVWENNSKVLSWFNCFKQGKDIYINKSYLLLLKSIFRVKRNLVFFLDYDGTLTPIVERPDLAVLPCKMRDILRELSLRCTVAIVSGRFREDVQKLVGIDGLFYAGSHGFDIKGPTLSLIHPQAENIIPLISEIVENIEIHLKNIEGVIIENKKFSVAVHYRLVERKEDVRKVKEYVYKVVNKKDSLRVMEGKKVFEILPALDWNKGKAVSWIIKALNINWDDALVIYIGDDTTDEDAFRAIRTRGLGILVSGIDRISFADFRVSSVSEVEKLFKSILNKS